MGQSPTRLDEMKKKNAVVTKNAKDSEEDEEVDSVMVVEELMKLTSEFEAVQCEFCKTPHLSIYYSFQSNLKEGGQKLINYHSYRRWSLLNLSFSGLCIQCC